jgi:fructose-1,6-bisphosphatase
MRVSGTDNSSNNYENGTYFIGAFDPVTAGSSNSTLNNIFGTIVDISSTAGASFTATVYNPFETAYTKSTWQGTGYDTILGGGVMTVTTSYTGFTVRTSSGTITGSVSVFGVNK